MGEKITTKEASKLTGYSVASLETMRCRKPAHAPPYYRIGSKVVYDRDELERFMQAFRRLR
jgi:hypothetical protein